MNDVIFYTIVSDQYYESVGTPKLINSFKKFHPNIPFKVFRQDEINQTWIENPGITWDTAKATFGKKLANDYRLVVNMDGDCMVTGELVEILNADYDLGSVMNNNDYDLKATVNNVAWENYVNAGLVASTNKEFWNIWEADCRARGETFGFKEQDILNILFWNKNYKVKVFDALTELFYYGTSSRGQWDKMYMEGDKIMLNNKQVKVIHEAGGHHLPKMVLKDGDFTPPVLQRLRELAS